MRTLYKLLVIISVIMLGVFPSVQIVGAQPRPPLVAMMGEPDASTTPMVTTYVSVIDQGAANAGAFVDNLSPADFEVTEDGAAISGVTLSQEIVGLAVVVVLDSGRYVNSRGVTGTRWDDARNYSTDKRDKNGLISELVDYRLTHDNDWSGLVGVAREITSVVALSTDQGEVRNRAYLMAPYLDKTPLLDGTSQALKLFESPDPALAPLLPRMRKSIVVLSDGIDIASKKNEITDLINKAQKQGIVLYTIGMDSPDRSGGFESAGLERLAENTDGWYIHHNTKEGRDQALALFDRIATQRSQYKLTYQTRAAEGNHKVCVRVKVSPGQLVCGDFTGGLRLPKLTITALTKSIEKGPGRKVAVEPKVESVDGYRRDPKKIVYLVDGVVVTETVTAPFKFEWDVSKVDQPGKHTIEARLYDSILPDTSYSSSNQEIVEVTIPAGEQVVKGAGQQWLSLLLVPVVIVLLILIVLMRKQIARGVRTTTSRVRAATQFLNKSKYKLVIVGGPNMGQVFWLNKQKMRIGRDENLEIPLLTDPHVSNLHAELTEDQLGYHVADLTSANGTYVNNQRMPPGTQKGQPGPAVLLQVGHVIRIGGTDLRLDRVGGTTRVLGP